MSRSWKVSAIVSACNNSAALELCLAALECQRRPPDEVVIADDGSAPEHLAAFERLAAGSARPAAIASQERRGFRLAASRNNGVRRAAGDYLLFLDADCVLFPDALAQHLAASDARRWLTGYGLRLTAEETRQITADTIRAGRLDELWPASHDPRPRRLRAEARRFRIKTVKQRFWPSERRLRQLMLRGLQFSLPRAAFERVNGFDENYEGWGREDLDLGLRLQLAGFRGRTLVDRSRALHLWHPTRAAEPSVNRDYYERPRHGEFRCQRGLVDERPRGDPADRPAGKR